jgi:hypothetical protein
MLLGTTYRDIKYIEIVTGYVRQWRDVQTKREEQQEKKNEQNQR